MKVSIIFVAMFFIFNSLIAQSEYKITSLDSFAEQQEITIQTVFDQMIIESLTKFRDEFNNEIEFCQRYDLPWDDNPRKLYNQKIKTQMNLYMLYEKHKHLIHSIIKLLELNKPIKIKLNTKSSISITKSNPRVKIYFPDTEFSPNEIKIMKSFLKCYAKIYFDRSYVYSFELKTSNYLIFTRW